MTASPGHYDLLRPRISRFTRALHGLKTGKPGAIHRARVESRRLRELLPVLSLDSGVTQKLGRRLRKANRRLGKVRELDVLLLVIDELHETRPRAQAALVRVGNELQERRKGVWAKASGKQAVADRERIARGLEELLTEVKDARPAPRSEQSTRWAIDARIARRAASLEKAIDRAGAVYFPERLHLVRIALKKLRYAVELRVEASGVSNSAELAALTRVQRLLGRVHDLQVFVEHLRRYQASLVPPDLASWRDLDLLVSAGERTCRRIHGRYVRERDTLVALCQKLMSKSSSSRHMARRASA